MMDLSKKETAQSGAVWDLLIQLASVGLLVLLVIAYATGEEYPHSHAMIGYGIAVVVIVTLLWLVLTPRHRALSALFTPGAVQSVFQDASGLARTLALLIATLTALPLFTIFLMALTHSWWGATAIDEMHEVVAYFALGLVAVHAAMVMIAIAGSIESHFRNNLRERDRLK